MNIFQKGAACLAILLSLTACDEQKKEEKKMTEQHTLIPRAELAGNPDRISVKLSPDGKYMSWIAPHEGVLNVFVADANDLSSAKPVTFDKGNGIRSYSWTALSDHLLFGQDNQGDENFAVHMIDLGTMKTTQVTPHGARAGISNISDTHIDEIVVSHNGRNPQFFDPYKYNLLSGEITMLHENNSYESFVFDDNNTIRFASRPLPDGGSQVDMFDGKEFHPFKTFTTEDASTSGVLGLNQDGSKLYIIDATGRDTSALFEYNLQTKENKLVGESNKADISSMTANPLTYEPDSYSFNHLRNETVALTDDMKAHLEYLQSVDKGDIQITARTKDDSKWIVAFLKDNGPIKYYFYDAKAHKAEFLFNHKENLTKYELNEMHPVEIETRDGLKMVSYLTLPKGSSFDADKETSSQPAPMVLLVHGGPRARDEWGYNMLHQWLSDRGFAVLSVNYRGSDGFGKDFLNKGNGEWAGKMHTDLLDAVSWAIAKGVTAKGHVAIMGGSYGGYATLVGMAMTPGEFKCGVDIVGPSNLNTLYNSVPPYWKPFQVQLQLMLGGDPETDEGKAILEQKSPLNYAQNIKDPLLIAQGANDPRVKQAEADQIVAAMKANNIPVTYLLFPDEGHGFSRPENKTAFYAVAEEFLAKCFGLEYEPVSNDFENSSIKVLHDSFQVAEPHLQ